VRFLVLLTLGCASAPVAPGARVALPPSSDSPLLGRPMPGFQRPTLQGGRFTTEDAAGRVALVEFFAGYCAPCQRRLPAVARLRNEMPDVMVVGISLDPTVDAALEQVRRFRLAFPVIHDAGNVLAGRFRVTALPLALVIGRDGRVVWVHGPDQTEDALRLALHALDSR